MQLYKVANIKYVNHNSDLYKLLSTEIFRVDKTVLDSTPLLKQVCKDWLKTTVFSNTTRLNQHLQQCKHLNVMYENERTWLLHLDTHLNTLNRDLFEIVEVGFNDLNQICKIGFCLVLNDISPSIYTTQPRHVRHLFVCVGTDGGIKSTFVDNDFQNKRKAIDYLTKVQYDNIFNDSCDIIPATLDDAWPLLSQF